MNIFLRIASRPIKRYFPSGIKKAVWNQEFKEGKWKYLDQTTGSGNRDIAYTLIEKYANGGKILDLGCGTGKLAGNLDPAKYERYMGVDISDVAIHHARQEAALGERGFKTSFTASDIKDYFPKSSYNAITFVESLYYIDKRSICTVLNRYANFLTENGVIIVRVYKRAKYIKLLEEIRKNFNILEEHTSETGRCSVVFRPRAPIP